MAVGALIQFFGGGVLNIGSLLMIGMMEQHFIEASPIEDLPHLAHLAKCSFSSVGSCSYSLAVIAHGPRLAAATG